MTEYYDLPSRFEPDADRTERMRRGIALCRTAVGERKARQLAADDEGTPANKAAYARAQAEKSARRRGDPSPIGDVLSRIPRPQGDTK